MKVVSWNIGGGYICDVTGKIERLMESREDFSVIIDFLKKENPDVVLI